jgi:hypothetical protein
MALHDAEPFPGVADAQLEAGGLAARQLAQPLDELQQLHRRGKRAVRGRRDAVLAHRHAARGGDLGRDLGPGSTPPWPGLAPWLSLISIIFTCGSRALAAKRSALKRPSSLRQPK